MAIELIAKIKPKNNGDFPMVDAADVEMADGTRLEDAAADLARSVGNIGQTVVLHTQAIGKKQDTLVSGENIKTVNGQSLLGEGNITIEGGGGGSITVDDAFNPESTNPVQNKVITAVLNEAMTALGAMTQQLTPAVTAADNGKVLAVVEGQWTAVAIPSAEGASF